MLDYSSAGGFPYSFYAPYDSLNKDFAGPQKFIAVKPKKLVISDSGIAFFTDDEGILKYKNVNRVVELDLEKLEITDSTDMTTEFETSYPVPGSTNFFISDFTNPLTSYYKWNDDSGTFANFTVTSGSPYASFIKED